MQKRKYYIVKWNTERESGTHVTLHVPRPGKLWMLRKAEITEVEATGRSWLYDGAKRKVVAIEAAKKQLKPVKEPKP